MMSKEQMIQEAMEQLKKERNPEKKAAILAKLVDMAQAEAPRTTRKDRSFISECTDIQQIKKEVKSAFGAKSKMKDNKAAVARYEEQIKEGQQRVARLYQLAAEKEDYISALISFNEHPDTVLQELIGVVEKNYRDLLEGQFSKAGLKREAAKYSYSTPESLKLYIERYLGAEGVATYTKRCNSEDQRVRMLNRLIKLHENGVVSAAQAQ